MEIRNYFRTIRRFIWWFIIPLLIVLVLSLILSIIFEASYQAPVPFAVNRKPQGTETIDYQFDSYYAILANSSLGDQFTEWLKGGAIVPAIYQKANLEEKGNLILKEWKVENNTPQDIEIIFSGRNKDRVDRLAQAALDTVREKRDEFTGSGDSAVGTITMPDSIIVLTKHASLALNLLLGLLSGIIVGLIFVYFKAIFSPNEIRNPKS